MSFDVTPIGMRDVPASLQQVSAREKHVRTKMSRANRGPGHEARLHSEKTSGPRRFSRRPLSISELLSMTSELARGLHADASAVTKPADRKHLGVAYAVMVDKLNVLSGRPTEILKLEADQQRPAVRALGHRLAGLVLVRPTPTGGGSPDATASSAS